MDITRGPGRILVVLYACAVALAAVFLLSVPVRALSAELDMPVPTAVVYPGQNVFERGLERKAYIVKDEKMALYVADEAMLEGRVARRTLLPGRPILLSDLKLADLVSAGAAVTLVYEADGLTITGLGTALQSAPAGQIVRVRNADSGVIVSGVVAPDGSIRIRG
ncbi:MAG: flagellar basal body P-ring formation chaperone FlgA [Aurantimonas endophytica]|uniref:Flagella basal body P-ring formation protein FlgA n=1 Tax=Aurantimonas endophytica TaxID=1522175 RepID=A0A7W6HGX2_9HYPH|nr:flagellar basal body P-ring formation chaperone FlgA [Aurantimonas endophytica]MBB4005035.1 flagella basal body P-ring formation protein FlgA [Aurantimonas endophytica]MCO6405841.1 flagellar basal body P-ring formation protein FlgA [Aurantimonas endophytica]